MSQLQLPTQITLRKREDVKNNNEAEKSNAKTLSGTKPRQYIIDRSNGK
jgi:hypothetical protein